MYWKGERVVKKYSPWRAYGIRVAIVTLTNVILAYIIPIQEVTVRMMIATIYGILLSFIVGFSYMTERFEITSLITHRLANRKAVIWWHIKEILCNNARFALGVSFIYGIVLSTLRVEGIWYPLAIYTVAFFLLLALFNLYLILVYRYTKLAFTSYIVLLLFISWALIGFIYSDSSTLLNPFIAFFREFKQYDFVVPGEMPITTAFHRDHLLAFMLSILIWTLPIGFFAFIKGKSNHD